MHLLALDLLNRAQIIALHDVDDVAAEKSYHGAHWQIHDLGNFSKTSLASLI